MHHSTLSCGGDVASQLDAKVERMDLSPVVLINLLCLLFILSKSEGRDVDANYVTCGSLVKLLNTRHNVRLHSHDVKYGSGSGQQSVTGVDSADDSNSYWRIRGKPNGFCQRGSPIQCGQQIRITHMTTGRNLHSHHFSSPLSNNQEVSAFGENGEGDDLDVWTVQCGGSHWERDDSVRFKHSGTDVFLSVTGEQYGHPIRGQREVHGMHSPNHHNYWKVMEGVFIQPSNDPPRHDEL